MASQTLDTCAEHTLPITDESYQRTQQMQRAQWVRAAILGANDGLLSTTSLMLGVGAAKEDRWSMILSGLAGAIAGACSMAVGEFVSVSTQRDIEKANLSHCSSKTALDGQDDHGIRPDITASLTSINIETNLAMSSVLTPSRRIGCGTRTCEPSEKVITEDAKTSTIKEKLSPAMMLEPKLLDSPLGRSPMMKVIMEDAKANTIKVAEDNEEEALPNPYKAATASALAFLCGSLVPLMSAMFVVQKTARLVVIVIVTTVALAMFGGIGALLGGSPVRMSAVRVLVGGWLSMAVTYGFLKPFDRDSKGKENVHTD